MLTFDWANETGTGYKLADDELFVLKFKPGNELSEGIANGVNRAATTATMEFQEDVEVDDVLVIQAAFMRADGTVVGDAYEIEVTVVA